ncbi:MAG: diguanylate cyclase, partial [Arenimonas sp.]|nr:diguanylate cyclase [Arenimonas sp.]
DKRVSRLFADGETLWVGTWKGLKRIIYNEKTPSKFQVVSINDSRIQNQFITAFAKDSHDRIWIGTYNAGLFFNTIAGLNKNTRWQSISKDDGLPDNSISGIQVDQSGNLWIGSNQGISFINSNDLRVTAIHSEDGAPAAPYLSSTQTSAGEIVFGGGFGLTIINPALWHPTHYKPKLVISRFESDSKKIVVTQNRQNETGAIDPWLVVPPNTKRLTIEFSAIDYIAAKWIQYRYRLLGHDDNWVQTSRQDRSVTFTSLGPGKYELQVQYSHDGHKWATNTLSQKIEFQPMWYQQGWFYISMFGLLFLLGYIGFQWRIKRYKTRQHILEARVTERTKELESANTLLKKQSAAIEQASMTDPLTGLKNRRFLTQHIEGDAQIALRRYINPIADNGKNEDHADLVFYLIDIDYFKRINDRFGHVAGDEVLIEMRRRLLTVFRGADYVVRWGGEEFLAVARGSSRANAREMAERIRQTITRQPFQIGKGSLIELTCSIGYAAYPFFIDSPEALSWNETFTLADTALYAAKNNGRNTWYGFDATNQIATDFLISAARDVPIDLVKLLPLQVNRN